MTETSMRHPLQLIKKYFDDCGIPLATHYDAYIFLVSEIGEVGDALMRQDVESGWVRNNPDKQVGLSDELADAYMMLLVLADSYHIDLDQALESKLNRKRLEYDINNNDK